MNFFWVRLNEAREMGSFPLQEEEEEQVSLSSAPRLSRTLAAGPEQAAGGRDTAQGHVLALSPICCPSALPHPVPPCPSRLEHLSHLLRAHSLPSTDSSSLRESPPSVEFGNTNKKENKEQGRSLGWFPPHPQSQQPRAELRVLLQVCPVQAAWS